MVQQVLGDAAERPLPGAVVAIGAGDQQIRARVAGQIEQGAATSATPAADPPAAQAETPAPAAPASGPKLVPNPHRRTPKR